MGGLPRSESRRQADRGEGFTVCGKMEFLSFPGALRAEESLFSWVSIKERFLASLGIKK